ncbi:MAG: hypothetical protein H7Y31_18305 [Chitinophagaceae bacterium]|nr:hypothetical protein [Chitinophagaceae bacterium]
MKKTLLLVAILFCICDVSAQKKESRNSIGIQIGPAFPIGKFASSSTDFTESGYAKIGISGMVNFSHELNSRWGLSICAYGLRSDINRKKLEKSFESVDFNSPLFIAGPGPFQPSPPSRYGNWEFRRGTWWVGGLFAGAHYKMPLKTDDKISLVLKALAGAVYVESPGKGGISSSDTTVVGIFQSPNQGKGFAYTVGGLFDYKLTKQWALTAGVDFLGTAPIKLKGNKTIITTVRNPNNPPLTSISQGMTTKDIKQTVQTVNVMLGVAFKF